MKKLSLLLLAALMSACASYSGRGLQPGKATEADVRGLMGEPTAVRKTPDGGRVLWYSKLPAGRESFAARLDPQGTLVSIEQRLSDEHISRLKPNASKADDVLDTLGPPYRVLDVPHLSRKVWEYPLNTVPDPRNLYVQLSDDGVVREVLQRENHLDSIPGIYLGIGLGAIILGR
jgi:hypothetical protein